MHKLISILLLCISLMAYGNPDKLKGIYQTEDNKSEIKLFKATNGKYYGKIVQINKPGNPNAIDDKNPDPKKRDRSILGLIIISDLEYDTANKEWINGKAYDPESGKTYDIYMWFENGSNTTLNIKGYLLGMRWVGRTAQWQKKN